MSDKETLESLNRDYVASVQKSDVERFDEILAEDLLACLRGEPLTLRADRSGVFLHLGLPFYATQFERFRVEADER